MYTGTELSPGPRLSWVIKLQLNSRTSDSLWKGNGGVGRRRQGWQTALRESLRSFWGGKRGTLLVVSLFVSQGRLSLHLLTLWEAQVEPRLHPGGAGTRVWPQELEGAGDLESDRPGPYQFYHLGPVTLWEGETSPAQVPQLLQGSGERMEARGRHERCMQKVQ